MINNTYQTRVRIALTIVVIVILYMLLKYGPTLWNHFILNTK